MSEETQPISHEATDGATLLPRRLSRRVLMKSAALAPIIALGKRAWAEPTDGNVTAFKKLVSMPNGKLEQVKQKAKDEVPGVDKDKFDLVARALWLHFHLGLGDKGVWSEEELLDLMYDHGGSGKTLATNVVPEGNFDPFGNHYQTNVCAYVCGHFAAQSAGKKKVIDATDYKSGREKTEAEMKTMMAMARSIKPAGEARIQGFGC